MYFYAKFHGSNCNSLITKVVMSQCKMAIENLINKNVEDITVSNDIPSENINKETKDEDDVTMSNECVKLETGDIVCGKTFNSYDEAVNSMRKWCNKTFTHFILKVTSGYFSSGGEELGRLQQHDFIMMAICWVKMFMELINM